MTRMANETRSVPEKFQKEEKSLLSFATVVSNTNAYALMLAGEQSASGIGLAIGHYERCFTALYAAVRKS